MKGKLVAAILALLAAALLLLVAVRPRSRNARDLASAVATAQVQAADFYISLPVEGVLEAARSIPIVNKTPNTQIVSVLADGSWVGPGDIIMKLNAADIQKKVDDLEGELVEAEESVRKAQADGDKSVQNSQGSLEKAKESLELERVQSQAAIETAEAEVAFLEKELEVAQGELERRERLLEERLVPVTDVEDATDTVRDRTFSLEAARRSLEQAKSDADAQVLLRELDLRNAELSLQQAEANLESSVATARRNLQRKQYDLDEAQEQLAATDLQAPVSGMLLLEQTWDQGMRALRTGDNVWEGQRVGSVIDPSEMWVRCDIAETDIENVRVGLNALVRVPAIGGEELPGEILTIDNLARVKRFWEGGVPGKKLFGAILRLTKEHPEIRPGMGASVHIVLDHVTGGPAVPLEAVFYRGEDAYVYRTEDGGYKEVPVKVQKRNNAFASVEADLSIGDVVMCEQPPADLLPASEKGARP